MNRSSKVTVAGGLAVALIAGGATTFARWYSEENVAVANVQTGELSFTTGTDKWEINTLEGASFTNFNPETGNIVPGDIVRYTTEIIPTLVGENLEATLTADLDTAGINNFIVDVTLEGPDGTDTEVLTEDNHEQAFTAEVMITFPVNKADGSMWNDELFNETIDLNDLKLTLEQNRG